MEDKFAVLLEMPGTQFLVYLEEVFDEENERDVVKARHVFYVGSTRAEIGLSFTLGEDGDGWRKAEDLLADVDEEYAEAVITHWRNSMVGLGFDPDEF